jgi:hypothetical protein
MASVPPTVTAPVVAVDGVRPVVPNVMDDTLAGRFDHVGALAPALVRTCPAVPAAVTA